MRLLMLLFILPLTFSYVCPSIITTKNVTISVDSCVVSFVSPSPQAIHCSSSTLSVEFNHSGTYNISFDNKKCTVDVFMGEYTLPIPDINIFLSLLVVFLFLAKIAPFRHCSAN